MSAILANIQSGPLLILPTEGEQFANAYFTTEKKIEM